MRLNQYMTSYNQRNDYESVSKCGCFVWQDQIDRVDLLRMQIQNQIWSYASPLHTEQGQGVLWCVPTRPAEIRAH